MQVEVITIDFAGMSNKEFCKDREFSNGKKGVVILSETEGAEFQF